MATQADVRRIALAMPEVVQEMGRFSFAVDGKAFAWIWMERIDPKRARVPNPDVIAVRVADLLEREGLIALDPGVFFVEPHYRSYPAVLVHLPVIGLDLLTDVLAAGWRTRAPKRLLR